MKIRIAMLAIGTLLIGTAGICGDTQVKGYFKSDGTYVAPHTRSEPNAYKWDNKSYTPSQPSYNESYYAPTKNYNSDWRKPSETRYQDNNPYNDSPSHNYDYLNKYK